jgi:hypothetical protein
MERASAVHAWRWGFDAYIRAKMLNGLFVKHGRKANSLIHLKLTPHQI